MAKVLISVSSSDTEKLAGRVSEQADTAVDLAKRIDNAVTRISRNVNHLNDKNITAKLNKVNEQMTVALKALSKTSGLLRGL